jgi:hypothetical protein
MYNKNMKNVLTKKNIITAIIIILIIISFGIYQTYFLNIAHSSFENYSKFRGCVELIEKTDTYGTCKVASGEIIKIVKFQNKWYLDGDLPSSGLNFL